MKLKRNEKLNRILFTILVVICLAIFCFAITPKTLQNDTYYTVTIGKEIYENGISNLTEDHYSWHELPYTYPHWLYDLCMYVVYNLFSWTGIYILTYLLCFILGISLYYISNKFSKNDFISFLITLGSMYILRAFVAARAQLVTFIIFAWTVYFIEQFLNTHKKRYAIQIILGALLVANLHCAVFPFYFVLFLPYIGEYIIAVIADLDLDKRISILGVKILKKLSNKITDKKTFEEVIEKINEEIKERKRKRAIIRENPYKIKIKKNHFVLILIVVMAVSALMGFLNPAGLGAYTYTYKTMQGNSTASINEHLPLTLLENKEFTIALCIFLAVIIFTDTKIKLSDLFMVGGLTYLAFKMRRQVSMVAIFGAFVLVKMISNFLNKYDKNFVKKTLRISTSVVGAFLLISIVIYSSYELWRPQKNHEYVDKYTYPVEACKWIKENLDLANLKIYNEYNYGSYMLYQGIPVFIDSRCDLYTPEFNRDLDNENSGKDIFSDALNIAGISVDYNVKFNEYGVNTVICYSSSKLAMLIAKDDNYKQLYDDGSFKIYERLGTKSPFVEEMEIK